LFYINGANVLWTFLVPAQHLEVIRKGGWWSFYFPMFDSISFKLHFITFFGLLGLMVATVVSYWICKKRNDSIWNVVIVFVLAFFLNSLFIGDFRFFNYKSPLFENVSMHVYYLTQLILALLVGTAFLLFTLYLKYFKFANPGGVR
jgi:hypothetical protein